MDLVALEPMGGLEGTNGFAPECLWDLTNRAALWQLGKDALVDPATGRLVATTLLNTDCGRSVLEYAVGCALGEDEISSASGVYTFKGRFGLAEKWANQPLSSIDGRWVTACLAQHLNGVGKHVPIFVGGAHPALSGAQPKSFEFDESSMFGNIFSGPLPAQGADMPHVHACAEKPMDGACGGLTSPYLDERICGTSADCGLEYLGVCEDHPGCSLVGDYWLCLGFSETLRSSLVTEDAQSLYEQCSP